MINNEFIFSSESVTEGHPDKVADQISDSILDEIILNDKNCRVACETLVTTDKVIISAEISTISNIDYEKIIRNTIIEIGYDDPSLGFDGNTCNVELYIDKQSNDISIGVDQINNDIPINNCIKKIQDFLCPIFFVSQNIFNLSTKGAQR